ncbi:unnamed protein product, partial [Discosporangium mesarthrocarpum]
MRVASAALAGACCIAWGLIGVKGLGVVGIVPPSGLGGVSSSPFIPISEAIGSAIRLAVDTINDKGLLLDEDLSLTLVPAASSSQALEALCSVLEAGNSTYGVVGPFLSSEASLLGSISNRFLFLPVVSYGAAAAPAEYDSTGTQGPGYLLRIQPNIDHQMLALTRLIVEMKIARDAEFGTSHPRERVAVLYTADEFGTSASKAFALAAGAEVVNPANDLSEPCIEIIAMSPVPVDAGEGGDFSVALAELSENQASITVLLAEGYDGAVVRGLLRQLHLARKNASPAIEHRGLCGVIRGVGPLLKQFV